MKLKTISGKKIRNLTDEGSTITGEAINFNGTNLYLLEVLSPLNPTSFIRLLSVDNKKTPKVFVKSEPLLREAKSLGLTLVTFTLT